MTKPTEVLMLNGTFAHDKKRTRPIGAKSERVLGDPPDNFDNAQRKIWREVVGNAPSFVLTSADRLVVEVVVLLVQKMRAGEARTADLVCLTANLSRLGWTPTDRTKVPKPVSTEDADDLSFLQQHTS